MSHPATGFAGALLGLLLATAGGVGATPAAETAAASVAPTTSAVAGTAVATATSGAGPSAASATSAAGAASSAVPTPAERAEEELLAAGDRYSTSSITDAEGRVLQEIRFSRDHEAPYGADAEGVSERYIDRGDTFETRTDILRAEGRVFKKRYIRATIKNGFVVRRRSTEVLYQADGGKRFKTCLELFYPPETIEKNRPAGRARRLKYESLAPVEKLMLTPDGIERWLAVGKNRASYIRPEAPEEACGLDDESVVKDEELAPFTARYCRSYDAKSGQPDYIIGKDERFFGVSYDNGKLAYRNNPDGSWTGRKSFLTDLNSWYCYKRLQIVDAQGQARSGKRYVAFVSLSDTPIFWVVQEMDLSGPRPRIKSHEITHNICYKSDGGPGSKGFAPRFYSVKPRLPAECRDYKVEIEDVTSGDPALQGEWIREITPVGVEVPSDLPGGANLRR